MSVQSANRHRAERGFTLIELIVAITLMGALSAGMLMAMRSGLLTLERTNARLEENRRAIGTLSLIRRQISATIPARAVCPGQSRAPVEFFRGNGSTLALVSSESLAQGSRGPAQIARYQIRGNLDGTLRLELIEYMYGGPPSATPHCGLGDVPVVPTGPVVLYDYLAAAHFSYYLADRYTKQPVGWVGDWQQPYLPLAVRIDLTPAPGSAPRLPMSSITIPLRTSREPGVYKDEIEQPVY